MKDEIRKILSEVGIQGLESIGDNDSMLEAGILDSVQTLEVITALESHFSIKIEDREVVPQNLDSVAGIVTFITKKLPG